MWHLGWQLLSIPIFVGASILSIKFNNFLVRTLYLLSAIWVGFVFYLFLGSILYLIHIGDNFYKYTLLTLVVGVTVYGILNARDIRINELVITLAMPETWKKRKMVFVSDLHLGHIWREKFAEEVVEKINSLSPDIIFIGGDLYDGVKVDVDQIISPLKHLKAPLGIFFVTGNHEEFRDEDNASFLEAIEKLNVKVLKDEKIEIDGIQIAGVYDKTGLKRKLFKEALGKMNIDRSRPSILLKHTPNHIDVSTNTGISLEFCGHTHRAQMWPLNFIAKKVFRGFSYGLKRSGATVVYTSSGVGTWGPPLRIGTHSEIIVIIFQ